MGDLEITINDLAPCKNCGCNQPLILQHSKHSKWYVACGRKIKCGTETKYFTELLDAAADWGLKENV